MTKYLEVIFIIYPVGKTCTYFQLCDWSETKQLYQEPSKVSPFFRFITMYASAVETSSSGNLLVSTSHLCNLKVFSVIFPWRCHPGYWQIHKHNQHLWSNKKLIWVESIDWYKLSFFLRSLVLGDFSCRGPKK